MEYLSCRDIIDHLDAYLSGEQAAGIRAEFERHLSACPPCVDYLKTYEATIRLGAKCFECAEAELPPPPEELIKAILASRAKA